VTGSGIAAQLGEHRLHVILETPGKRTLAVAARSPNVAVIVASPLATGRMVASSTRATSGLLVDQTMPFASGSPATCWVISPSRVRCNNNRWLLSGVVSRHCSGSNFRPSSATAVPRVDASSTHSAGRSSSRFIIMGLNN
jgi:hypothetical protein